MTIFFFNTFYGGAREEIGVDLPDADIAWRAAALATGEWFKEISSSFQPGQDWQLEVTDDQKKSLYLFRIAAEKR